MINKRKLPIALMSAIALTSCASVRYEAKDYILEMPWKDNFRILQLTDIHLANKDNQDYHFDFMDLIINDENARADLIVITGDLFTYADKNTARRAFKWLDSHKIPWTVTFGNHDQQNYYSIDWITGYLNSLNNSDDSYCIFKDLQDDDINGNANFAINLMNGNTIKEQIIMIDSNRYNLGQYKDYDAYIGYDAIHDDQVEWYERLVNYTIEQNNGTVVPSVAFFHIPLPELEPAYLDKTGTIVLDQNDSPREKSCPGKMNTGFFNKMVELGSTNGAFFGHDHYNNYIIELQGITMGYGVHSTDRVYSDKNNLGGQIIEIKNDGSLEITRLIHSYEELD